MKILLKIIFLHLVTIISANGQTMFHENFEVPDSVVHSGSGSSGWSLNNRIQTDGLYSDSGYISGPGDSILLQTLSFNTVGRNLIILSFNHIAKIEFFDRMKIWVSPDSGASWIEVNDDFPGPISGNCVYLGNGLFQLQSSGFQEASYAGWFPGLDTIPDNTWWKQEVFDLTTLLYNRPNAMLRFVIRDLNNTGAFDFRGYFIDEINVTDVLPGCRITGSVYNDLNANGGFDPGEFLPLNSKWVYDSVTSRNAFVWQGNYQMNFSGATSYNISMAPVSYFNLVPTAHTGTLLYTQIDSLRNFGFQASGSYNDLQLDATSYYGFRPGKKANYCISVSNVGTNPITPTLTFYPDSILTFDTSSVTPSFISADSIIWNFGPMNPFDLEWFYVRFHVDSLAILGQPVNSNAILNPTTSDFTPVNNLISITDSIISSYDPNIITVSRNIVYSYEIASQPFLDYVVEFQNTGSDTAFNISILNRLPLQFEISTMQVMGSSAPMNLIYNHDQRLMIFDFDNIMLPDSSINEPASHGFVWYRIRLLDTLIEPDSVLNYADIYFDLNLPVRTNTSITQIIEPTNVIVEAAPILSAVQMYPNPTVGGINLVIEQMKNEKINIVVFDVTGKKVASLYEGKVTNDRLLVTGDLTALPAGVYIIRTYSDNKLVQNRIIKM
jgi:Secretion system C-terminal sorting domain